MIKVGEIYWHYKNPDHLYRVLALAKHSETLEDQAMYDGKDDIWVRPARMWNELVNGVPRFQLKKD